VNGFQEIKKKFKGTVWITPEIVDRTKLKTRTMTICLTPDLHKKLAKLATKHNQKPAAMARILIESGVAA